ncbi:MAG TPA: alpha/beta hydrolase [Gemmatimonadales bacterium]|nr:alpha/beta hydrolase [Gemmatimonadales bacterium]
MSYPLIELGGQGPPIVVLPANGFPPDTYRPAVEPLLEDYRVVCLPPRALWEDAGAPPAEPGSWTSLAEDLLEGMRRHRLTPAIAIGHSFGAVAALLAAVREPARFRALALLDPTILPPAVLAELAEQRERGETKARALVQGALTRRDRFNSTEEAVSYWRTRRLFADWSDAMLRRYATAMLRPAPEGGFGLSWPRDWEAHYYESIYTETWQELSRLDRRLPLLAVRGEHSDTFLPDAAARFAERVPWVEQRVVAGRGHLFPHSAPEETSRILVEWLAELQLRPARSAP